MATLACLAWAAMQILITNIQLDHRTGTEIVVRDLEGELRQRGHRVCVYTPRPGVMSDEIERRGGHVITDLECAPFRPDVIHAHHNSTAIEAALRFPGVPVVFVCHSRRGWMDMVAGVPNIAAYVTVDRNCQERMIAEGIAPDSISLIINAVDLQRIRHRTLGGGVGRRAAVFANNAVAGQGFAETIRLACVEAGYDLDVFGSGSGASLADPEQRLAEYDVVFAKARCAIEAMAAGCSVIAIDVAGCGGLVTADRVDWMLDWNVGDRCLQQQPRVDDIVRDLQRVDAVDASAVRDAVVRRCDLRVAATMFEDIYVSVVRDADISRGADGQPTWIDAYEEVARYATDLEARLWSGEGPWSMPSLPPQIGAALKITIVSAPRQARPGAVFEVEAMVHNTSREQLASIGPTPVHWSYHWLDVAGEIVVFDGLRTHLTRAVHPGERLQQMVEVQAPDHAGDFTLRLTMVQESVTWFTGLPTPVFDQMRIAVIDAGTSWNLAAIGERCGLDVRRDAPVVNLGFVSCDLAGMLTFALDREWVERAIRRGCSAVIVPEALCDAIPAGVGLVVSDVPLLDFRRAHETLLRDTDFYGRDVRSVVDPSARVHPSATIDHHNVVIGRDAIIGAGAVVSGRVAIGERVVVHPGAVIGAAGLQTVEVAGRRSELSHAGGVSIGADTVVFSNATIARGLFRQTTVLGESCRVGNNAFVSHNTSIGSNTTIAHGAVVNGNVTVGEGVWVGPNATIADSITVGDGCRVSLGATVIGSVPPGAHVSGPPAIDHRTVLRQVAQWRSRRTR